MYIAINLYLKNILNTSDYITLNKCISFDFVFVYDTMHGWIMRRVVLSLLQSSLYVFQLKCLFGLINPFRCHCGASLRLDSVFLFDVASRWTEDGIDKQ